MTASQRMESFKALEKEIKTKAFSKEGLILATKLDPAEQAKAEARQILEGYVDSLSRQIEQAEAEIELLQANAGSGKKKTKSGGGAHGERERELERQNERAAWHVEKLEAVMRMLENGKVTPDQVTELKEDVSYFVESNQEEDFEEDEGIYDELNLEEDEEPGSLPAHSEEPEGGESDLLSASEGENSICRGCAHAKVADVALRRLTDYFSFGCFPGPHLQTTYGHPPRLPNRSLLQAIQQVQRLPKRHRFGKRQQMQRLSRQ